MAAFFLFVAPASAAIDEWHCDPLTFAPDTYIQCYFWHDYPPTSPDLCLYIDGSLYDAAYCTGAVDSPASGSFGTGTAYCSDNGMGLHDVSLRVGTSGTEDVAFGTLDCDNDTFEVTMPAPLTESATDPVAVELEEQNFILGWAVIVGAAALAIAGGWKLWKG